VNRSYVRTEDIEDHIRLASNVPARWRIFVAELDKNHGTCFAVSDKCIAIIDPDPKRKRESTVKTFNGLGIETAPRVVHIVKVEMDDCLRNGCLFHAVQLSTGLLYIQEDLVPGSLSAVGETATVVKKML
jgi:hypothetical protein